MNKKISQFELTNELQEQDLITLVQNGENRNITGGDFTTSLADTFATNERVDGVEEDIDALETKVDNNYTDLSNKIVEGDQSVTNNLTSTITSYYDVLNNQLITLEDKHDKDMSEVNGTVQEWIDDIDNRSTLEQLQDALNRLTVAENTITALAEIIANGGGGEGTVGYHTQPTSTITSLQGYYKGTSANPLTTTDTLNQALSKLENQVEAVSSSSGSLPVIKIGENTTPTDRNIYTAGKVKEDYIFKSGDTVPGRIIYTAGLQGGTTFRSGWDGIGASLYPTNSKWNLELDNLFVRGNMTVNTLTINEIKAVGGDILVSLADMKCIEVEETSTGYKCYFDTEDGTKYNEFIVNDQAICQKFDGRDVKRYWRAVTEVGSDYIVLSKEICEPGSSTPAADDEIILLGHRVEGDADYNEQMSDRRNAIFISAKGSNAPRIAFYSGIDDFSLEGKDKTVIGKDSKFVGTITVVSPDGEETTMALYRGKWSADKTYYYYDYVSYNGSLWIATTENINQIPSEDSIYWELYVPKGEDGADGQPGDDVAKWVEITGGRMFLYDGPDFTGTPTPTTLTLNTTVYGIDNPRYKWEDIDHYEMGTGNYLIVTPDMFSERTTTFRCTVEDGNTGYTYYDEVQVAKLCNGAEGLDAYYIDLTNYSASVPFDADGQILVDPTTVYTEVFVYHGIDQIPINSMTAYFSEGSGTCKVESNKVTLTSLTSTMARITLTINVENNIVITKDWYINQSKNGENGFNGEDAVRTYLTGDQFFHYAEYSKVPTPETITLTMDTTMEGLVEYKWYWTIAGTSDWKLLDGETESTLVVTYNGIYFQTGADEITFRCVVTNGYTTFEDIMTINNVRDGESVYVGALENENMSVPSTSEGYVGDWRDAFTYATLKRGSTTFKEEDYTLTSTQLTGVGTLTIDQERKLITVNGTSIPDSYLSVKWQINFVHDGETRDTVVLTLSKNPAGKDGSVGNSSVQIYCNTNATSGPTRPTLTSLPSSSGMNSGGYVWYPDPTNSYTTLTWTSTGYYNPNTGSMDLLPDGSGYRWTKPTIFSPLNGTDGEDGADGRGIGSIVMQYYKSNSQTTQSGGNWSTSAPTATDGYYIWTRLYITYTDGSIAYTNPVCTTGATGDTGPGLSYRGAYNNSTTYGWTTNANGNVRDVVSLNDKYYAVSRSYKGRTFSGYSPANYSSSTDGSGTRWFKMNSFNNIATGLLFAEKATIAGLDFYNNIIQSQTGTFFIDGSWDPMNDGTPVMAFGNGAANAGTPSSTAALKIYGGGTLTVGDGTTTSNAGISGQGTSSTSVRFWAGSTHSNSSDAPFRVLQNGSMYASNATIKGNITATTANFTGKVTVGNLEGWKIPGVLTISHYEADTRRTLYSQGNYEIKSIQRQSVGVYKVYHNIPWSSDSSETAGFRNQFVLLWNGISRYGADNEGFRGWIVAKAFSYQMFYIYCYDSEGTIHDIGGTKTAVDLIILGYGNE